MEGDFDDLLVGLAGADDLAVVVPDGDASPLPLFGDLGVRFVDEGADASEGFPAPVTEVGDALVDELGGCLVGHGASSGGLFRRGVTGR